MKNMSRPKLGQNFLIDVQWQKKIVESFQPPGAFGEIGPGHGELTDHLQKLHSNFVVFEKDRELVELHRQRNRYGVVEGDFVDWNFELEGRAVKDFSLIGNLPYEAGTAIVRRVVEHADQISTFVFMLQKEVVDRLLAKPKTRDYGSLTVLVRGQYDLESIGVVPPGAFKPAPKIYSEVFRGVRRSSGTHPLDLKYHQFLMGAFAMKRKTLKNVWKSRFSKEFIAGLFSEFKFSETQRAEEIEIDLWPKIYTWIIEKQKA